MMHVMFRYMLKFSFVTGVGYCGYLIGKSNSYEWEFRKRGVLEGRELFPYKYLWNGIELISVASAATPLENDNRIDELVSDVKDIPAPKSSGVANRTNRVSEIMKYGFPSLDNIRSYDNFVLSYDRRNRVANWVFEHLTRETVKKNANVDRTQCDFFEDDSIHPFFRSKNSDYKRSGYDRGHLAAAGNHKSDQRTCAQTFVLSNMTPQVGEGFNRGIWNNLEKYVRTLARKYGSIYVCTGPLYLPRMESDGKSYVKYQVIGSNTVAVPTHFFKVIVVENGKNLEMEAYVLPNAPIPDNTPLKNFMVANCYILAMANLLSWACQDFEKWKRNFPGVSHITKLKT